MVTILTYCDSLSNSYSCGRVIDDVIVVVVVVFVLVAGGVWNSWVLIEVVALVFL